MTKKRRSDRKEDLRRLSVQQQIARIRRYHGHKIAAARKAAGMNDPWVSVTNIVKRFRVICLAGLLMAYRNQELRKNTWRAELILI